MSKIQFNGEIKRFKEAALALYSFRTANPKIAQWEALQGEFQVAQAEVKNIAKEKVKECGEAFKKIINGVHISASLSKTDKFSLYDLDGTDIQKLDTLRVLTIDTKKYRLERKNGNIPGAIDSKCRKEVIFQYRAQVGLQGESK